MSEPERIPVHTFAPAEVGELDDPVADQAPAPTAQHHDPVHVLVPLFEASRRRAVVNFSYRGRLRTLEPWGLTSKFGNWYVVGFDHDARPHRPVGHVRDRCARRGHGVHAFAE